MSVQFFTCVRTTCKVLIITSVDSPHSSYSRVQKEGEWFYIVSSFVTIKIFSVIFFARHFEKNSCSESDVIVVIHLVSRLSLK
jgi:hypothetical protein